MAVEKVTLENRNPKYSRRFTSSQQSEEFEGDNKISTKIEEKSDISVINRENRYEVIYVDVDKIKPYRDQSRTYFDESEIMAMAKTISEHGIRQPLTVISMEDGFQVISGERRLRAAKIIGLRKVPVIIISDDKKAEELALIENIQRTDLHPIELGKAYAKIMARTKETHADIADRISVPLKQVYEYINFAKIPDDTAELIIRNNLGRRSFLRELLKHDIATMREIIKEEIDLKEEFKGEINGVDIPNEQSRKPLIRGRSLNSNFSLISFKIKNGKLDIQEAGLLKCNKSDLPGIKVELNRILDLINKMQ